MKASWIGAVVGLSAWIGSGWLLTEAYPSEMRYPFVGCIHFVVIALVGLLVSVSVSVRARTAGWTGGNAVHLAAAGLGIFVLPGAISQIVAGAVSSSAIVALFCTVPLMLVLGTAWFGQGSARGLMMPSLVGLFGALLIFPVDVPHSAKRAVCLIAALGCCVATAGASVWMFDLMQGFRLAAAVLVVGSAGAVTLGLYGAAIGWPPMTLASIGIEVLRCMVFDLPIVWTTVWLMQNVPPARLAARYLITPLVTWIEGYAFVRGPVEVRSIVALTLMAAGAGMLLMKDESDEVPGLQLR